MSEMSIVVGVDETESSRRALEWAAREAIRRGAKLHVITTWTSDSIDKAPSASEETPDLMHLAEETQQRAIEEVVGPMDPRPPVTRSVMRATPVDALARASQEADLVVVGTHGRGPVRSFLLGSVSLSVIKHASCPVVVMPPLPGESEAGDALSVPSR
jgi:nucleotide-binding universal stress UspA family protein